MSHHLITMCNFNGFGCLCNDRITTEYVWKDRIHLQDLGTSILSTDFIEFAEISLVSSFNNGFWRSNFH